MSPADAGGQRVLAARLSGPLQSWGEHSPYTQRGTLPYPSYSGLLGLARAALGSPRDAEPSTWAWLRTLGMAVRIDLPGAIVRDFHTINPPPSDSWASTIGSGKKGGKAAQTPFIVPVGSGRAWAVGNAPSTLITERHYLTDAVFTWLVDGPEQHIARLADALARPAWQISLGRKACPPDWPLLLGTTTGTIAELATRLPIADPTSSPRGSRWGQPEPGQEEHGTRTVDLHVLSGAVHAAVTPVATITHTDDPVGSHPHDGRAPRTRQLGTTSVPVTDRPGLLAWASTHLESA